MEPALVPDPASIAASGDPDVVTMGEAMRLLVAEPGVALERAARFASSIAGAESNVAIGLARLGHRSTWLGRLGDDPSGRAVRRELMADGVDVSGVEMDPAGWTGILLRDSHFDRVIDVEYRRAGSAACGLSPAYLERARPATTRIVHVSGITAMISETARDAVTALFAWGRASGALLSLDVNLRRRLGTPQQWREIVGPIARSADLVFGGEHELHTVIGSDDPARALVDAGAYAVVTKHPDHSASVLGREGTVRLSSVARSVVDPVGAGDALVAGYLDGHLRGADQGQCLRAALLCAAAAVGAVTDTEGMPSALAHQRAVEQIQEVDR